VTDRDSPYAALSRVAAQVGRAGSAGVSYDVSHLCAPADGPPAEPAGERPPGEQFGAEATLMCQAGRAAFRLHTWTFATAGSYGAPFDPPTVAPRVRFRDVAPVNPGYSDGAAGATEVLVALRHDSWAPNHMDALVLATVAADLTAIAVRHGLPVLSLEAPTSPFRNTPRRYRFDGSGEAPRAAGTLALRMVLGEVEPGGRMDAFAELAETADRYGFGLDVRDRRLGRVSGQWWTVARSAPTKFADHRRMVAGWVVPDPPRSVLLVTVAGPARPGATAAILADLAARNVGIAAVTAVTLQGVGFVNLVVPVAPAREGRAGDVIRGAPIGEGFGLVATECGLSPRARVRTRSVLASGPAVDHKVFASGPYASPLPRADAVEHPLWATWTRPLDLYHDDETDAPALLLRLLAAQPESADRPRVTYQHTTISADDQVTGRLTIAVPLCDSLAQPDIPRVLTDLCARVSRTAAEELARRRDLDPSDATVALDWRERWVAEPG
jgi:predicted amino acid-binding ACT domain protein